MDTYGRHMNTDLTDEMVAGKVQKALDDAGKSKAWLATTTGIPRVTLLRRLNAQTSFTVAELAAVADALGCRVESLVRGSAA